MIQESVHIPGWCPTYLTEVFIDPAIPVTVLNISSSITWNDHYSLYRHDFRFRVRKKTKIIIIMLIN